MSTVSQTAVVAGVVAALTGPTVALFFLEVLNNVSWCAFLENFATADQYRRRLATFNEWLVARGTNPDEQVAASLIQYFDEMHAQKVALSSTLRGWAGTSTALIYIYIDEYFLNHISNYFNFNLVILF